VTTPRPPLEAFDAYQSGEMSDDEAASFEEELFAAAALGTADEAAFVDRISLMGQFLLPRGGFDIGSSRARIDQLIASGLRVQLMQPKPEYVAKFPKISDDAQIVATHVPIDVRGYDSVDVEVEKLDGTPLKVFRDIGWDPLDGTVYAICEAPLARIATQQRHIRSRIIGHRDGQTHIIAQFETVAT
jgi:hypothetical protein